MIDKIKSLVKDTAIYGVFRILGKMLTFLLTPLYANYILGQDLAFINFMFPVLAIINVLYTLGMESAFFRFYNLEDRTTGKQAFSNAYINIALMAFTFTLLGQLFADDLSIWICKYLSDSESISIPVNQMTMLIRLSLIIPLIDSFTWVPYDFLRMVRKAHKFVAIQFTMIVITVTLTALSIIVWDLGVMGVLLSNIVGSTLGVILLRKEIFQNLIFKIDANMLKQMYRFGIPMMLASLPAMLLQVLDKFIMPNFADNLTFNTYAINYKLGIPMMLIVTMFDYAWKPFFLTHYKDDDSNRLFGRVFTYFTLLSAVAFLVFALFMPFFVRLPFLGGKLIPPMFWHGMGIIPIILAAYYFNGAITNFAAAFHITKKTHYITITMWSAAIVNIVLNLLLIPRIGIYGAAWATFAAYFVGAGVSLYFSLTTYTIRYEWHRVLLIIGLLLSCYFPIHYFASSMSLVALFIVSCIAIGIFIALLYIFKFFTPEEVRQMKKILLRKG